MKKIFSKLLIIAIVSSIITVLLCYFSFTNNDVKIFSLTKEVANQIKGADENTPGVGEFIVIAGIPAALTDFGFVVVYFITALLIPCALLFMIVLSQVVSRLIQIGTEKNWKNIISKICTWISVILQLILCCCLIFNIFYIIIVNKILLIIALILNILCSFIFIRELIKNKKSSSKVILEQEYEN